jgi:hypothetical protein
MAGRASVSCSWTLRATVASYSAGVGVSGVDAVDVAVDTGGDDAGEQFGVTDGEGPPAAVVVVLAGAVGKYSPGAG